MVPNPQQMTRMGVVQTKKFNWHNATVAVTTIVMMGTPHWFAVQPYEMERAHNLKRPLVRSTAVLWWLEVIYSAEICRAWREPWLKTKTWEAQCWATAGLASIFNDLLKHIQWPSQKHKQHLVVATCKLSQQMCLLSHWAFICLCWNIVCLGTNLCWPVSRVDQVNSGH